jgi:hypothetical protein
MERGGVGRLATRNGLGAERLNGLIRLIRVESLGNLRVAGGPRLSVRWCSGRFNGREIRRLGGDMAG